MTVVRLISAARGATEHHCETHQAQPHADAHGNKKHQAPFPVRNLR
jgi:hypothetical protein